MPKKKKKSKTEIKKTEELQTKTAVVTEENLETKQSDVMPEAKQETVNKMVMNPNNSKTSKSRMSRADYADWLKSRSLDTASIRNSIPDIKTRKNGDE